MAIFNCYVSSPEGSLAFLSTGCIAPNSPVGRLLSRDFWAHAVHSHQNQTLLPSSSGPTGWLKVPSIEQLEKLNDCKWCGKLPGNHPNIRMLVCWLCIFRYSPYLIFCIPIKFLYVKGRIFFSGETTLAFSWDLNKRFQQVGPPR